jgi:alpha-tubulin suppressor-like RCC1 family protein
MEQDFIDILQKLIAEQGKETLLNASKCKPLLADYTRNEYKKESRLLLQALEAGVQKAIDTSQELAICKKQQIRLLHEDYGLDAMVAANVVNTLALVLRGDTARTEIQSADQERMSLEEHSGEISSTTSSLEGKALASGSRDKTWAFVSAGGDYSLAIKADGSLWAWGRNTWGQLGNGKKSLFAEEETTSPIRIGTTNDWASVSAGYDHSLAIKTDGGLWAWGHNLRGQLGDSTITDKTSPIRIGTANDWASVSAGGNYSLAIKADGSLWAWGRNTWGQLGNGREGEGEAEIDPIRIGTGYAAVVASSKHNLAIKKDGSLWAWGSNTWGQLGNGTTTDKTSPVRIGTANDWAMVSIGDHSLAIKTDGSLWVWGNNDTGQLGNGRNGKDEFESNPIRIGADKNWALVSAGTACSFAIKTDGSLWAWGWNEYGQLGDGTMTDRNSPVRIDTANDWASMSGRAHSLAIKKDGSLWAWGSNNSGQLGDGTTTDKTSPVQV